MKRRTQFMTSVLGMLAVFVAQIIAAGLFNERGAKAAGTAVTPFLFIFYNFYNLAFNTLVCSYPTEVWPFATRAKGMMILQLSAKCTDFVNTLVNPTGLDVIGWKFCDAYIGWPVIECIIVYFLFVETKGPSLEAIAAKFDGEGPIITYGQLGSNVSLVDGSLEGRERVEFLKK